MNVPGGWELVLILVVLVALFGAKRLPDASRSIGRSLRIFKAETKGLIHDDDDDEPVHRTVTRETVTREPANREPVREVTDRVHRVETPVERPARVTGGEPARPAHAADDR